MESAAGPDAATGLGVSYTHLPSLAVDLSWVLSKLEAVCEQDKKETKLTTPQATLL